METWRGCSFLCMRKCEVVAGGLVVAMGSVVDAGMYRVAPLENVGLSTFDVVYMNDGREVVGVGSRAGQAVYVRWNGEGAARVLSAPEGESLRGFDNDGRLLIDTGEVIRRDGQREQAVVGLEGEGYSVAQLSLSGAVTAVNARGEMRVYEQSSVVRELRTEQFSAMGIAQPELQATSPGASQLAGLGRVGQKAWRTNLEGMVAPIGITGTASVRVEAVNDEGLVALNVEYWVGNGGVRQLPALAWGDGQVEMLGTEEFTDGYARLLTRGEQGAMLLGQLYSPGNMGMGTREVVWVGGEIVDFASLVEGVPDGAIAVATAANGVGDLAGYYLLPDTGERVPVMFLRVSEIPEAGNVCWIAAGALLLGRRVRDRGSSYAQEKNV